MAECGQQTMLYDQACLHIFNNVAERASVFSQTSDCYLCDVLSLTNVSGKSVESIIVPTTHEVNFLIKLKDITCISGSNVFGQHGMYGLNITGDKCSSVYMIHSPEDANDPLWVELICILTLFILWVIGTCGGNSRRLLNYFRPKYVAELETDLGSPSASGDSVPIVQTEFVSVNRCRTRLKYLDTFRGITIVLMIFVNNGGGKYWFFEHATWNGLHFADVVFPWFAWIMGVCIVMSIRSQLRNRTSRWQIFFRCLHRSLVLITLGLVLNSRYTNDLRELRIPGVLQRLGFSYFIVVTLECIFMKPQNSYMITGRLAVLQDLISSWIQWLIMIGIVGLHVLLSMCLPVENCPTGYLGPGGLHDHSKFAECTGGAAGYLDRLVFRPQHMYNYSTPKDVYHTTVPFDPEGLLGALTMAFTVFLGAQAGRILLSYSYTQGRIQRWLVWAVICGVLGGCLCGWSVEDGPIPINKNLWSLSFALITSCMAFIVMSLLFIVVDHTLWWTGAPFQQCGRNSIFIYVGSILVKDMLPWSWKPFGNGSTHTEFLLMDTWATFLWILTSLILDSYEIYITI